MKYKLIAILLSLFFFIMSGMVTDLKAAEPFDITNQFSLGNFGYDSAGGDGSNYFHTFSGIEERDADGNLINTIENPNNTYGLAFSNGTLYSGSAGGDKIYSYLGGNLWDLGLGTPLSGARGLAASSDNFFWLYNNGANLGVLDKSGNLQSSIDVSGILGAGYGLGYNPNNNSLLASNGTDNIFEMVLNDTNTGFDSWTQNAVDGMGAGRGVGYNPTSNTIAANSNFDTGMYIEGPEVTVVPEPVSSILFITGGSLLAGRRFFKRLPA